MSVTRVGARSGAGSWILTGAIMGLLAGIVFMIFEMVVAWIMQGNPLGPPRMISAIALGQGALPMNPTVGLGIALPVAMVIHFVLSVIFGGIFGVIVALIRPLGASRWALIVAATVLGLLLWIVNFQVIGRLAFPWFLMVNQFLFGFLAHTFFYGTALGLLLAAVWRREE